MFALMALGGDIGCSLGPTVVGFIADMHSGNLSIGLFSAMGFPIFILICITFLIFNRTKELT